MELLTKQRVFVLCTDGSAKARHAFDVPLAHQELVEEFLTKYDKIKVLMITDAQKTYLSDDFTPKAVQDVYRNALISRVLSPQQVHHTKYEIIFEERNSQFDNPKEQITYSASKLGADYVFLGSFGRKGDQYLLFTAETTSTASDRLPCRCLSAARFPSWSSRNTSRERRTKPKASTSPAASMAASSVWKPSQSPKTWLGTATTE